MKNWLLLPLFLGISVTGCKKEVKDSKIKLKPEANLAIANSLPDPATVFENSLLMGSQGNYNGYSFFVGDVTGDGNADVIAVSPQNGRAVVWPSNGTNLQIPSGNPAWMENQGNYSAYNFMVADMTGDGKADLVAVSPANGRAVVWKSSGSSFVASPGNPAWMENQGNYTGYNFLVADMTGDGKSDLVAVSPANGRAVVWASNGTSFTIPPGNPAWMENRGDYTGYNFMAADVTGDGKADLIGVSPAIGRAVVWASNGISLPIPSGSLAWMENQGNYTGYNFMTGDMTGDGKSDLVAVYPANGRAVVWASNGSSFTIPTGNPAWMENQGNLSNYTFGVTSNGQNFSGNKKSDLFAINISSAQTVVWSLKHSLWESTIQRISNPSWNNDDAQTPYLAYVPGQNKLIMELLTFINVADVNNARTALINSVDCGNNWTARSDFPISKTAIGLTNAGNGALYSFSASLNSSFFKSTDAGVTWHNTGNSTTGMTTQLSTWDPVLVINKNGTQKILQIGYSSNGVLGTANYYSQPYIRYSTDSANNWTTPVAISNFKGFSEVCLLVAANGDVIAACRKDPDPIYYPGHNTEFDNYSGLAISVSKDQGQTWDIPKTIFEYGRHHPSMILLNDGNTILMTYAVRKGGYLGASDNFSDSFDGHPSYGVEAIISTDNGKTWDINNRYILSKWEGNIPLSEPNYFFRSSQSTSTIQLPDGTLLTAYGTGRYRTGNASRDDWLMDIDLIRWNR